MAWILTFERPGLEDRNFPITRPETMDRIVRLMGFDSDVPSLQFCAILPEARVREIGAIVGFMPDDPDVTIILFREI